MAKVQKRNTSQTGKPDKVKFRFDIELLEALIKYTQCEYLLKSNLYNLKRLMEYTDLEMYTREVPVFIRLNTLLSILRSMVDKGLVSLDLIKNQLRMDFEPGIQVIEDIKLERNMLNISECEYISKFIDEKLQYIEIYQVKDELVKLLEEIDSSADYNVSYYHTIQQLKNTISKLMVSLQDTSTTQALMKDFAFSDKDAENALTNIVKKSKLPTSILQTGIRQLNAILAPGFQSSRLYTILGGSGKFKSGTLLNIADQIRRFNPQIIPIENGLRKCILFITLENSIEETIERLFDMYSPMDTDIRNMSPEEVIHSLREEGEFQFTDTRGIDIFFHYAGNLEMNTADIYALVSELNNKGYQPIAIVLDYIKRIESTHFSNGDERVRMSFVAKELKTIAQYYQIPVITAMQLNREGNSIIDAGMRDNKQDVARFVGSSSIGNAWDIIEDSDWVCLINLELQKSTGKLFLTFKRLKMRGKSITGASDYFNHPFVNAKNIRLATDTDLDAPISVISLATDLESIQEENDSGNSKVSVNGMQLTNIQAQIREKQNSKSILSSLSGAIKPNTS